MLHICDWYATFGHLAGYTPDDPKAAAHTGIPPPDAIDMWPYLSGAVPDSPRVEIALRGGPPEAGQDGTGYIARVNGSDYKLIRGNQHSYFPGPHMPNDTDNGATTTACGAGCLFNLTADWTEHTDIADAPANAALLAMLQAKAVAADNTYFQSDGSSTVEDPKAKAAAINEYHGFWGPWLPPGPVPPPPPPPTPGGFQLVYMSKAITPSSVCLGVSTGGLSAHPTSATPTNVHVSGHSDGATATGSDALRINGDGGYVATVAYVVELGLCGTGQSRWHVNLQGKLYNSIAGAGVDHFIRHHPPGGTCAAGTPLILGMGTAKVYSTFDTATGQILASDCPGMCVAGATPAKGAGAVLVDCVNPTQHYFTEVAL